MYCSDVVIAAFSRNMPLITCDCYPQEWLKQPWPTPTNWMSQRQGNERLGGYPYFRDWDSAWYFVLQVSKGYRIVVLRRPPTAPEVASAKLSKSNPMAPTKPSPSFLGQKVGKPLLEFCDGAHQEWLAVSSGLLAVMHAKPMMPSETLCLETNLTTLGPSFQPISHQLKAQIPQLCRSHPQM